MVINGEEIGFYHFNKNKKEKVARHCYLTAAYFLDGAGGVSDACAVCKGISSMKALQLGRGLVKSTNFHSRLILSI